MTPNVQYAAVAAGLIAALYLVNQDGAYIAVGGVLVVGGIILIHTL